MFNEKLKEVLENEGVASIVSWGEGEPHIVNTWNSYIVLRGENRILIPAWAFKRTEKNVNVNDQLKIAFGSKSVEGYNNYQGTGFVVCGKARFISDGEEYDMMKSKFSFLTRVLEITVDSAKQML